MPAPYITIDTTEVSAGWVFLAERSALAVERPLLPVMLDAKPYVLFQDDEGELGLIGRHCPHRGADLCFGRLENNGLRCPFHGWHFDRTGQCVEQPAEPEGSKMAQAIKVPMVALHESDGKIYVWTGVGEPDAPYTAPAGEAGEEADI